MLSKEEGKILCQEGVRPRRVACGRINGCCTYPVLEWIAERVPAAPVSVRTEGSRFTC